MMFSIASCTPDSNTASTTTETDVTTDTTTPQPAIPEAAGDITSADQLPDGKAYIIKDVDATIKSPRRVLIGKAGDVSVMINYGSPAVNERIIYGDLVPYNKVWRTGANEATRITFDEDVVVGEANKKLPAGTYSLFTLPASKDDWTVIFNKEADQWGAYDYDESKDAVRVKGKSMPAPAKAERMDFALDGNTIQLMWDDLMVAFPVASTTK